MSKLFKVTLGNNMGVSVPGGGPSTFTNFRHEDYEMSLGAVLAPSLPGHGDKGLMVGVVKIQRRNRMPNSPPHEPVLVPLGNVAGWELLTEAHLTPKSTSNNTQAVVPGRGVGHSPAVSGRIDPGDYAKATNPSTGK